MKSQRGSELIVKMITITIAITIAIMIAIMITIMIMITITITIMIMIMIMIKPYCEAKINKIQCQFWFTPRLFAAANQSTR